MFLVVVIGLMVVPFHVAQLAKGVPAGARVSPWVFAGVPVGARHRALAVVLAACGAGVQVARGRWSSERHAGKVRISRTGRIFRKIHLPNLTLDTLLVICIGREVLRASRPSNWASTPSAKSAIPLE